MRTDTGCADDIVGVEETTNNGLRSRQHLYINMPRKRKFRGEIGRQPGWAAAAMAVRTGLVQSDPPKKADRRLFSYPFSGLKIAVV